MADVIALTYEISPDDFTRAGEASSDVKSKLKQVGVSPAAIRKVAIAMYEGEINMVIPTILQIRILLAALHVIKIINTNINHFIIFYYKAN